MAWADREFPLIVFGQPAHVARETLNSGPPTGFSRRPTAAEQGARLTARWTALREALDSRRASISTDLEGIDPELVLVLEIIGDVVDFARAIARIPGFEFLAEIDEVEVSGDGDFVRADDPDASFDGTLFLLASNQEALSQLLSLWDQWRNSPETKFAYGLGRIKEVFSLLRDIRRWSAIDRLRGTGVVEDFQERIGSGREVVPAEIELWFRRNSAQRQAGEARVRAAIEATGGQVVTSATIPDIAYHAVLATLPVATVQPLVDGNPDVVELARVEEIAFFRPHAQSAVEISHVEDDVPIADIDSEVSDEPPLVAILDGVPLQNHVLLSNRLSVDDPDDLGSVTTARDRIHGTAVASLVIHGDREHQEDSIRRAVYLRPILQAEGDWPAPRECIPSDELTIDLVHRSVVRMLGTDGNAGSSPSIKLINLSVGDPAFQLATTLSPWARLLDWLSYEYKVLFVISAGNHPTIEYAVSLSVLESWDDETLRDETLKTILAGSSGRRILSPSEAVNCLCIGATHHDHCSSWVAGSRKDLLPYPASDEYPSPVSAIGMGYKRSIKPDLLTSGGRVLFRHFGSTSAASMRPANASTLGPGLKVASPGKSSGSLNSTQYFNGTSAAAAMASHSGALILEELADIRDFAGDPIDERYWAVLAKALLVHTTALPLSEQVFRPLFSSLDPDKQKDAISRFFGYGVLNPTRLLEGESTRATMIGCGSLKDGEASRFELPLPPSLSSQTLYRRLSITVAYFAPIRSGDRRHRAAVLFVKPDQSSLKVKRKDADWRTVRRGTVQHEILEGTSAAAFVDGDSIAVQVNCRNAVQGAVGTVPFGLAVTLEVDSGLAIPIYAEIAQRLRARVQARVQSR